MIGRLIFLMCLVGPAAQAGIFDRIPTESGNYCLDEGKAFLQKQFQRPDLKIERTEIQPIVPVNAPITITYWTDLCKGYFMARFDGSLNDCTNVQYGEHVYYMDSIYAEGECSELMPSTERPTH